MKFFSLLLGLWMLTGIVNASDNVTCAIEESACEYDVSYEELVGFLAKKGINPFNINNPDLYVAAYTWLNTPYRYGGNSKNGIDCSRFAAMLQEEALGIEANGGSSGDMFKMGYAVERNELKEGDLVFFRIKAGRISHVGVYLQNGKFAHSSTSKGVIISDLSEAYWNRYFYKGARYSRFVPQPF
jgi:lipoprotein Spr